MKHMKLIKWILLFISIFQLESCDVNTPEEDKQLFRQFVGRWKLVASDYREDSSLINSARITLQDDSLFFCTTSVFWRNDSSKYQPSQGEWSVIEHGFAIGAPFALTLIIDTLTVGWELEGGTQDSMMHWSTILQGRMYSWKLDN